MHVLGHRHIANQSESILLANFAQRFHENVSSPHRSQQGKSTVTAERNEVQIPSAIVPFEVLRHPVDESPTFARPGRTWGTLAVLRG
jgi:hypothetical protein